MIHVWLESNRQLTLADGMPRQYWNIKAGLFRLQLPTSQPTFTTSSAACVALVRDGDADIPLFIAPRRRDHELTDHELTIHELTNYKSTATSLDEDLLEW